MRDDRAMGAESPLVLSVSADGRHRFSKPPRDEILLIEGWGVDGDAHAGETVQHLSRVRRDPAAPNLRQVHLIHAELFDDVALRGHQVTPGQMGENITTRGIDLLGLPTGAVVRFGGTASVEITGLRNPCLQIDGLGDGLMREMVGRDASGEVVRRAGVMAVVRTGGPVRVGDEILVELPTGPHRALQPV